jgi:predicted DNA-binding transcriptional regulator YafY
MKFVDQVRSFQERSRMYHPTTRVLTVLELLQAHGCLSGADLAARLEVDRRTVRRYITMLQDLGIPVGAARGRYGGYQLRPGFKLPPLMFSDDEALAVTLGLIAARRLGLAADAAVVEGALAKIDRVLPAGLRQRVQAVQEAVAFSLAAGSAQPAGATVLALSAGVRQARQVRLRYRARDEEETERILDPYGLVYHWERWYAVGWCHLRRGVRVFRLDRILGAELTDATFVRPPDFDSLQHVLGVLATAPAAWSVEVLLETTLEEARRRVPPGSAVVEQTSEGVVLRSWADSLGWMARVLLLLECPFVVRQPPELREVLRQLALEVAGLAERQACARTSVQGADP